MPPNSSTIPKYLIITHIHILLMQAVMRRERARGRPRRRERLSYCAGVFDDLQHQTKWKQIAKKILAVEEPHTNYMCIMASSSAQT